MTIKSKGKLNIELARNLIDTFEIIIRKFLEDVLRSYYGDNWWEQGIPRPIRERIEQRKVKQRKQEPKKQWKNIEMLTFNDYREIILRRKNWDSIFQKYFYEKSYVDFPFERLTSKRNDVFHNRKIINKDLKKIETFTDEIYKYLPDQYTTQISIDLGHYERRYIDKGRKKITESDLTFKIDDEIKDNLISRKSDWYDIPIDPLIGVVEKVENELVIDDVKAYEELEYEPPSNEEIITTEKLLTALSSEDWQPITHLIFKIKVKDMIDARFLQVKLKELERKGIVSVKILKGKKHYKLK